MCRPWLGGSSGSVKGSVSERGRSRVTREGEFFLKAKMQPAPLPGAEELKREYWKVSSNNLPSTPTPGGSCGLCGQGPLVVPTLVGPAPFWLRMRFALALIPR